MHRPEQQNRRSLFLTLAFLSACILGSGAVFSAADAGDAQQQFTPAERKALMGSPHDLYEIVR